MREVVSLVFGIRDAKLTIAKDEGGKVDCFLFGLRWAAGTDQVGHYYEIGQLLRLRFSSHNPPSHLSVRGVGRGIFNIIMKTLFQNIVKSF